MLLQLSSVIPAMTSVTLLSSSKLLFWNSHIFLASMQNHKKYRWLSCLAIIFLNFWKMFHSVRFCQKLLLFYNFIFYFKWKKMCNIFFLYLRVNCWLLKWRLKESLSQSIAALSTSEDAKTDKNDISEFKEGRNILLPFPQKTKMKIGWNSRKRKKIW